jgi:flagellar hook-length control protein FliK
VALTVAAPPAQMTAAPAPVSTGNEVPVVALDASVSADDGTSAATKTADAIQQVTTSAAPATTVPVAIPSSAHGSVAPDPQDGSQDAQPAPAIQDTHADAASTQNGPQTIATPGASPLPDAAGKSTKTTDSRAGSEAAPSSVKPPAANSDEAPASSSQVSDPSKAASMQNDQSSPSASSSSDQARAMLQAALAAHGHAATAAAQAPSTQTSSSAQNHAPAANPTRSSAAATSLPVTTVPVRPAAPVQAPAPDDSATGASNGSAQSSASLLSAAIARTQESDSGSFGASAGDAHGQSGARTSGGPLAGAATTLASGASPLGASFSLPTTAAAQSAAAGTQTPGLTPQAESALPGQIVQAIRMQWQIGIGQATIRLDPAHLGELSVSLRVDQGTVNAQLHADTPEVRAWIQQHAHDLRGALEQQGLRLGQMAVTAVDPDGRRQSQTQDQPPPRSRRTTVDAGARFTVQA